VSTIPNYVCITFELPASIGAAHIFVIGDFNQWCSTTTPMRQDHDGIWRATIDLPWGVRSEFRYLIDGQWKTDYYADGLAAGLYSTGNSVVYAILPIEMLTLARTDSQIRDSLPDHRRRCPHYRYGGRGHAHSRRSRCVPGGYPAATA
jgi:hypothetical protein